MAKGLNSKNKVLKVLTTVFPNSFINEKNLIIPFEEDGETVQIKVALTASKSIVEGGAGQLESSSDEYTKEEIEKVNKLLVELGLDTING